MDLRGIFDTSLPCCTTRSFSRGQVNGGVNLSCLIDFEIEAHQVLLVDAGRLRVFSKVEIKRPIRLFSFQHYQTNS